MLWPFPNPHPDAHVLLQAPCSQGTQIQTPVTRRVSQHYLGGLKGKFGIKIPKFGIKIQVLIFLFFPFLTQPKSVGGTRVYLWEINKMESQRL